MNANLPTCNTGAARVAVIGAGCAGAMAAFRLKKLGYQPVVFEANDYIGGRARTRREKGFIFDTGAVGLLGSYTKTRDIASEIGMDNRFLTLRPKGAIPKDGVLRYLDMERPIRSFLTSDLFSVRSKLMLVRVARDVMRLGRHLNYEQVEALVSHDTQTVEQYAQRRLNDELYHYLADTLTRGAWLAPSDQASVIQFFWTAKNFTPHMYSLRGGMDSLATSLLDNIEVRLSTPVLNVDERPDAAEVTFRAAAGEVSENFDGCIVATPPAHALSMFPRMIPAQADYFRSARYSRSVNVHFALTRRPKVDALYIMVPKRENEDVTTVFLDHLKAPDRAPPTKGMVSVFMRAGWCDSNFDSPDDKVIDHVASKLTVYFGDLQAQAEHVVTQRWPHCALLVEPGIFKRMSHYYRSLDPMARIQFAGDYAPFSSINTAVVSGEAAARRIVSRLAGTRSRSIATAA